MISAAKRAQLQAFIDTAPRPKHVSMPRETLSDLLAALTAMQPEINAAVLAERERCAKVCDSQIIKAWEQDDEIDSYNATCRDLANAIRQGPTQNVEDRT